MSYIPMTPEEAAKLSIRQDGIYPFEVLTAEDKKSKEKGNPMIALELRFFDQDGSSFSIKDWLVHSDNRWSEKKFLDFVYSTGGGALLTKYASGQMLAEDCLAKSGYAMIGLQKGKAKEDGTGNFPDRNVVKYYTTQKPSAGAALAPTAAAAPAAAGKQGTGELDEDVPF